MYCVEINNYTDFNATLCNCQQALVDARLKHQSLRAHHCWASDKKLTRGGGSVRSKTHGVDYKLQHWGLYVGFFWKGGFPKYYIIQPFGHVPPGPIHAEYSMDLYVQTSQTEKDHTDPKLRYDNYQKHCFTLNFLM